MVKLALDTYGQIDILVNNAGGSGNIGLDQTAEEGAFQVPIDYLVPQFFADIFEDLNLISGAEVKQRV